MDASIVTALATQAGFEETEQTALHEKLARFAGLVLALRDANQSVQVDRVQEFLFNYSFDDVQELAASGELEKLLPTFEILPQEESSINFADLKPIDFAKKE